MTAPAMKARGLYHIYRERGLETVALKGADLTLQPRSWTSVMGPSGSGKSTLVNILAGFVDPSGGSVFIGDHDITRLPVADRVPYRRRTVGLVRQRGNLHPLLTVGENVGLPLLLDGVPSAQVRQRVASVLAEVGLADRDRQDVRTLSGGEAQRVAVAAALVHRPVVLLADELTGELDEATTVTVLDVLEELRAGEDAAVLTVTHNPLVARRADQPLELRDGILVDAR